MSSLRQSTDGCDSPCWILFRWSASCSRKSKYSQYIMENMTKTLKINSSGAHVFNNGKCLGWRCDIRTFAWRKWEDELMFGRNRREFSWLTHPRIFFLFVCGLRQQLILWIDSIPSRLTFAAVACSEKWKRKNRKFKREFYRVAGAVAEQILTVLQSNVQQVHPILASYASFCRPSATAR